MKKEYKLHHPSIEMLLAGCGIGGGYWYWVVVVVVVVVLLFRAPYIIVTGQAQAPSTKLIAADRGDGGSGEGYSHYDAATLRPTEKCRRLAMGIAWDGMG